jgi:CRP/FNR family transcriptional regulator
MPIAPEAVRQIPIFALLGPEDLALVAAMLVERRYDRGAIIVLEDTARDALFYLHSGLVKVFTTSPEGKEQVLRLVYPGQIFNGVAAFSAGSTPTSAAALEESVVYAIGRAELQRLVTEQPEVAVAALQALALLLRFMIGRVEDLAFHHVTARVARILLEQDDALQAGRVTHLLTRQEMASIAGTAREMVIRALKELEAAGTIALRRGRVVILSRERLIGATWC